MRITFNRLIEDNEVVEVQKEFRNRFIETGVENSHFTLGSHLGNSYQFTVNPEITQAQIEAVMDNSQGQKVIENIIMTEWSN